MTVVDEKNELVPADLDSFVATVGTRVRAARKETGISRRILSERSGVSQRYLALLENGGGNISIVLLYKVANALDHPLSWFIAGDENHAVDNELQQLFSAADATTRQQVLALLGQDANGNKKQQRICLIGLRGAGKSTFGAAIGESLGLPFIELNREIELLSGFSVAELMNLYGQEGYRRLERQAIEKIIETVDSAVIAAAGGVVSEPATYQLLLSCFHTVWLKASAEEHMQRVMQQGDDRPMADNPSAMAELESILVDREALYAQADRMLDTSNKSIGQTSRELDTLVSSWI